MADSNNWLLDLILGGFDLSEGLRGAPQNRGSTAADIADPFRGERGQYWPLLSGALTGSRMGPNATALQKLLTEPGSFEMDPGAKFAMEQGLEGVARHGNSMFGTTRSGNTAVELDKFGTGFANQAFNERVNQLTKLTGLEQQDFQAYIDELMGVSGVKTGSPAAAADAYLGGWKNRDLDLSGGLSKLLGGGLGDLLGGGASALGNFLKGLGGTDFSGLNLTGGVDDFLRSIGLGGGGGWGDGFPGASGYDPSMMDFFRNIFSLGGTAPGADFQPFGMGADISDSTRSILDGLFGSP